MGRLYPSAPLDEDYFEDAAELFREEPVESTSEKTTNPMMSIVYMNKVIEIMGDSKPLRETAVGVLKQTGYTAAGSAVGGILGGPPGALVGAIMGAFVGYSQADPYDSLIICLRRMTDREKTVAAEKIQALVGSASIEQLVNWIATEGHRQLLIGVLGALTAQAQKNA